MACVLVGFTASVGGRGREGVSGKGIRVEFRLLAPPKRSALLCCRSLNDFQQFFFRQLVRCLLRFLWRATPPYIALLPALLSLFYVAILCSHVARMYWSSRQVATPPPPCPLRSFKKEMVPAMLLLCFNFSASSSSSCSLFAWELVLLAQDTHTHTHTYTLSHISTHTHISTRTSRILLFVFSCLFC